MNSPYAIIQLAVLTLSLYFLTHLSARLGIIEPKAHRQFWNVLLLITFLCTALLGLFLAVQVNYKIDFRLADRLLVWHVDFGIAMSLIAFLHFLRHIDYYLKMLVRKDRRRTLTMQTDVYKGMTVALGELDLSPFVSLMILGFSSVITQIVVLREFMSVFYGNELVIGIILAVWMTLTGTGALSGQYIRNLPASMKTAVPSLFFLSLLPLLTVFLLYALRNVFFDPGSLPGLSGIILLSLLLLAPFCLLSGYLFTRLSGIVSKKYRLNLIGEAYAAESAGSIAGGAVLSFLLIYFLSTFQILCFLLFTNVMLLVLVPDLRPRKTFRIGMLAISLLIILLVNIINLDRLSRSLILRNQDIVYLKDTPYGKLTISESAGQLNFFENNNLLFSDQDKTANEENVHYTMVQHPDPQSVLLISGGISGTISEIRKYQVGLIDYVEVNPWIIRIGRKFTDELENDVTRVISKDARRFIRSAGRQYDVIIINLPEPKTAQLNRYYTKEFFAALKRVTTDSSVIGLSLPSTMNYVSEEAAVMNSVIYNTLSGIFDHLLFVPGDRNYLLASDGGLSIEIPEMIEGKGIETVYVNRYYLDSRLLAMRSSEILDRIDRDTRENEDFRPLGYFFYLRFWMSRYDARYWSIIAICGFLLMLVLIRSNLFSFGMFTAGFTASSLEILILLSFQVLYGYVYHFTGIIITFFMLGLVIGVLIYRKIITKPGINSFIINQSGIGIYALLLPFLLMLMQNLREGFLLLIIFPLITLLIAALTSILFTGAVRLIKERTTRVSARVYSYDLIGSAVGALLVSVFMIPLLGIFPSAWIIGGLNMAAALFSFVFRSRYID